MLLDIVSPDDLRRLTGLRRSFAVKNYLKRHHIPYLEGADGWPRVLYAVIAERLGVSIAPPPAREPQLRLRNG
jgi:hypothetical protein